MTASDPGPETLPGESCWSLESGGQKGNSECFTTEDEIDFYPLFLLDRDFPDIVPHLHSDGTGRCLLFPCLAAVQVRTLRLLKDSVLWACCWASWTEPLCSCAISSTGRDRRWVTKNNWEAMGRGEPLWPRCTTAVLMETAQGLGTTCSGGWNECWRCSWRCGPRGEAWILCQTAWISRYCCSCTVVRTACKRRRGYMREGLGPYVLLGQVAQVVLAIAGICEGNRWQKPCVQEGNGPTVRAPARTSSYCSVPLSHSLDGPGRHAGKNVDTGGYLPDVFPLRGCVLSSNWLW